MYQNAQGYNCYYIKCFCKNLNTCACGLPNEKQEFKFSFYPLPSEYDYFFITQPFVSTSDFLSRAIHSKSQQWKQIRVKSRAAASQEFVNVFVNFLKCLRATIIVNPQMKPKPPSTNVIVYCALWKNRQTKLEMKLHSWISL